MRLVNKIDHDIPAETRFHKLCMCTARIVICIVLEAPNPPQGLILVQFNVFEQIRSKLDTCVTTARR